MRPTTLVEPSREWTLVARTAARTERVFAPCVVAKKFSASSEPNRPSRRDTTASVTRASKNHARVNQSPVVCILRSVSEPEPVAAIDAAVVGFRKRSRGPVAAEFKRVFARRTQGSVDANDWCARKWNKTSRDKGTRSSRVAPSRPHSLCET